ncbi:DUF4112 domain-containing protein [Frigoriglobus tundricola]|uniref:DUF4112 domain-containing protein n=1 Tax=Frigoriglobus tundricola TaxID=2774151 RepID=UPI00148ED3E4|nr:DUF4112 domain-containing protein [Frigoriglobus tundricola]
MGPKLDAAVDAMVEALTRDEKVQLAIIRQIRKWMDEAVTVPGTKMKLGLDPVLGLIPVIGDLSSAAVGGYVLHAANKLGVPTVVMARMLVNLAIDALIGFVPFVGDYLDVLYKANAKNVALVEQAIVNRENTARASWWRLAAVLAVFLLIVVGGFVGAVVLAKWIWTHAG